MRIDRDGVVLSGADTPHNYQQLIRFITYTNRKPAYYLDRVFKLTCSELSGRFSSNEYIQTLAVIHPKEKTTLLPHSTPGEPPVARMMEPVVGHAQLSPHHAEIPDEYSTTNLHNGRVVGAGGSHAVTIVAAACIGFLLLMAVVGAARVRGANKQRRAGGDELTAETEMAWDDSALAITVNPMDKLNEAEHGQGHRDDDADDSGSSDSEDGSFARDDDLETTDCENDCEIGASRHHQAPHCAPHELEWDNRDV